MAPELFTSIQEGYSYEVDYYGLGILMYELLTGQPPFGYEDGETESIKKKIVNGIQLSDLACITNPKLLDLLKGLLNKDKTKRLGMLEGFNEIVKHEFFGDIDIQEMNKFFVTEANDLNNLKSLKPFLKELENWEEILYIVSIKEEVDSSQDFFN